jgi:beta-glucosidase
VYDKNASQKQFDADVAIVVVGERPYAEFFGDIGNERGSCSLTLTDQDQKYIETYAAKVPKVVVVFISGRPLVVTKQIEQSDAFVAAWLPGSEGDGVAQVLFGDYNFSGKLPYTWPKSIEDFDGKFGPGFRNDSIAPLFKYGYGLDYSNFK